MNFSEAKTQAKYCEWFGFIESIIFCRCRNSKEEIFFLKILISKFFGNKR
jgi:hypothetical protein